MSLKLRNKFLLACFALLTLLSCNTKTNNKSIEQIQIDTNSEEKTYQQNLETEVNVCNKIDTIIFRTAMTSLELKCKRLYPNPCLEDSVALKKILYDNVFSVNEIENNLVVFLNLDMFGEEENQFLPQFNDNLIQSYYSKYYEITEDDDIPHFIYLRNEKDLITFIKTKSDGLFWDRSIIKDTILTIKPGIKIGMNKNEFIKNLGLKEITYGGSDVNIILSHIFNPNEIWYKKLLCSKVYENELSDVFGEYNCKSRLGSLEILLEFKNDNLTSILLYTDTIREKFKKYERKKQFKNN